jgi:MFS family permease
MSSSPANDGVSAADVRSAIEQSPMSRFQVQAVVICLLLNVSDGFDVMAMAFAAPYLVPQWGLTPEQLGGLLSAGLAGMTLGSIAVAPLADRWGRRSMIVWPLVLVIVSMLMAAMTRAHWELLTMRFLTGVGIGAMLPSLNTMVAEYASLKRREVSMSVLHIGFPIGATVGGLIAGIYLVPHFGWPAIFVFGSVTSLLLLPFVIWGLPESLDFLLARRPNDALNRANAMLKRIGHRELAVLPPPLPDADRARVVDLVRGSLGVSSVCHGVVLLRAELDAPAARQCRAAEHSGYFGRHSGQCGWYRRRDLHWPAVDALQHSYVAAAVHAVWCGRNRGVRRGQ